ncbi:hypothetical protein P5673_029833, partial [Acropora cervicornis]
AFLRYLRAITPRDQKSSRFPQRIIASWLLSQKVSAKPGFISLFVQRRFDYSDSYITDFNREGNDSDIAQIIASDGSESEDENTKLKNGPEHLPGGGWGTLPIC